jgi:hypothetical protein
MRKGKTVANKMCKHGTIYELGMECTRCEREAAAYRIAQLEAELAEARELLREAYDGGTIWRGHRIYNHIKPAAPTADEKGE